MHSFEFITATFTTIGYGSLYAVNEYEKGSMCVLIVISLIMFSLIMKQIQLLKKPDTVQKKLTEISDKVNDFYSDLLDLYGTVTKY